MSKKKAHVKDSDCTVDHSTMLCKDCGVDHSGECIECSGRGFHKPNCPLIEHQVFDLSKALSGAPLVTRDGRKATDFRKVREHSNYPFDAKIGSRSFCFTDRGTYWIGCPDPMDLFLSAEAGQ